MIEHLWDEFDGIMQARPSCPTSAPDLTNALLEEWSNIPIDNPIEHLWDELERRLRARPSLPTSAPDLTDALLEEWSSIPIDTLLNLVDGLPRRVESVIAAKVHFGHFIADIWSSPWINSPKILFIFLLSLWIFFSIGENSLLYSLCMIITILLKGSLLSRWCILKFTPLPQGLVLVSGVIFLQIYIIGEDLRISTFSLIILVPLSTVSGVSIFLSQLDSQEEGQSNSQVIGIFSRSSVDEYNWLSAALRSSGKVVPFCITNSNFREFRDQVSKCAFAILYHSKTRGRVNITDVTDSLYDDEVKHMAQALGREKVLVVVDDLDDSSDGAKNNILQSQGTIRDQARDLYLFTREEKRDKERIREKLQPFLRTLSRGSSGHLIVYVVGILILCGPWLHYCVGAYDGTILILSNIGGSLLIYNFLLPFSLGSPWAGLPALVVVMVLESLAAYWYCSGLKAVLLFAQSVLTLLYAVLLSASSSFSAAP